MHVNRLDAATSLNRYPSPFGNDDRRWAAGITALGILLFLIRLAGPFDLADGYHQERQACYIQDILQNGHWICQRDVNGEIASKPPMHAWLSALASLPFPRANRFTLLLPGALATVGLGWLILYYGRLYFGTRVAGLSALAYLLSAIAAKQVALVRIDGLFAFMVTWTALAAFRAWEEGGGWTWPWLLAAAATLTKGPLALLLVFFGFAAVWWESRASGRAPLRGSHLAGISAFLLLTAGWFAWAYHQLGQPLIEKMIFAELFRHAVTSSAGAHPGSGFYEPVLYFLSRFAPWSFLTVVGIWRVFRQSAPDPAARRFEKFVCCYVLGSLFLFSIVAHQRPDLLFPVFPLAALLAGRELDRLLAPLPPRTVLRAATAGVALALVIIAAAFTYGKRSQEAAVRTRVLKDLARSIEKQVGPNFPFTYVDSYYTLQFYLNTMRQRISLERASQLLKGSPAAFVMVRDLTRLRTVIDKTGQQIYILEKRSAKGALVAALVSNHPRLEWTDSMAAAAGPMTFTTENARSTGLRNFDFYFSSTGPGARATIRNQGDQTEQVRAVFLCGGAKTPDAKNLAPREEGVFSCP